ncbi:MAG: hypothetical protein AAF570_10475, partial [Bacteroidota bacterium]
MKHFRPILSALLLLAFFAPESAFGQGWERYYDFDGTTYLMDLHYSNRNSILTAAYGKPGDVGSVMVGEVDIDGNPAWHKRFGLEWPTYAKPFHDLHVVSGPSNGAILLHPAMIGDGSAFSLSSITPQGVRNWHHEFGTLASFWRAQDLIETGSSNGSVIVLHSEPHLNQPAQPAQLVFTEFDPNGPQIRTFNYTVPFPQTDIKRAKIQRIPGNGFVAAWCSDLHVQTIHFNQAGDPQWIHTFTAPDSNHAYIDADLIRLDDGDLVISWSDHVPNADTLHLQRLNPQGQARWHRTPDIVPGHNTPLLAPLGQNAFLYSYESSYLVSGREQHLFRGNIAGELTPVHPVVHSEYSNFRQLIRLPDHSYVQAIFTEAINVPSHELMLSPQDSTGRMESHQVSGQVYADLNANCQFDGNDYPIPGQLISISNPALQVRQYVVTDSTGHYQARTTTGDSRISIVNPADFLTPLCPWRSHDLQFDGWSQTADNQDFAVQVDAQCPYMWVELSTSFIRRCFDGVYFLDYANYGTETAESAHIILALDTHLLFRSANHPHTVDPTTGHLRFDLGNVAPGTVGQIVIEYYASCEAAFGITHCSEAHIYPDTSCDPVDPNWDGSSVQVTGTCEVGNVVQFRVENQGQSDMSQSGGLLVIEDDLLKNQTIFQLPAGQDTTFRIAGNGSTWACLAEQSPGHPGQRRPIAVVEGCGTQPDGSFSVGFASQFFEDDRPAYLSIDCRANIGSYDPNDKRAIPEGVGADHAIPPNTQLEYKIRFQNTGTDTAFTVVIRDTLQPGLELETVRMLSASHPYRLSIETDEFLHEILVWTFDHILLPDSNINEPKSHGFVKFTIEQSPDLAHGTLLSNRAGIYFDFNEVV